MMLPRKTVVPVVVAVCGVTLLVGLYTFFSVTWFIDFFDAHLEPSGALLPTTWIFYRRYYAWAIAVGLAVLGIGFRLVVAAEVRANHLAWYVGVSGVLCVAWLLFILLIERGVFVEYRMPA